MCSRTFTVLWIVACALNASRVRIQKNMQAYARIQKKMKAYARGPVLKGALWITLRVPLERREKLIEAVLEEPRWSLLRSLKLSLAVLVHQTVTDQNGHLQRITTWPWKLTVGVRRPG